MNEQRVQKVDRMKISERERDNLSEAKADAEAFLDKEAEIRRQYNILWQVNIAHASKAYEEASAKQEKFASKLQHEQAKLQENESAAALMEKAYMSTNAEYDRVSQVRK
jgi:structural maintenance of chromosome 4